MRHGSVGKPAARRRSLTRHSILRQSQHVRRRSRVREPMSLFSSSTTAARSTAYPPIPRPSSRPATRADRTVETAEVVEELERLKGVTLGLQPVQKELPGFIRVGLVFGPTIPEIRSSSRRCSGPGDDQLASDSWGS